MDKRTPPCPTTAVTFTKKTSIVIDRVALAKQGDNVLGSVRPSVTALMAEPFDL